MAHNQWVMAALSACSGRVTVYRFRDPVPAKYLCRRARHKCHITRPVRTFLVRLVPVLQEANANRHFHASWCWSDPFYATRTHEIQFWITTLPVLAAQAQDDSPSPVGLRTLSTQKPKDG